MTASSCWEADQHELAIRGVHQRGDCQLVLVDLPGVQRPRDALTARMARSVQQELDGADAALLMVNAVQGVGPGDRFIAHTLAGANAPVTIAVFRGRFMVGCPEMSPLVDTGLAVTKHCKLLGVRDGGKHRSACGAHDVDPLWQGRVAEHE